MHLEHAEHEMSQAMEQAGLDPAIIYASQKTGRIVSEDNIGLLTDAEVAEWNEAINEYYDREKPPRDEAEYPIGTVALYGPDDKVTTKIVAGVIANEGAEALIERWGGTDIKDNAKIQGAIRRFFDRHGVKSVAAVDRNMGCPHEEGEDFPVGKDCPFCPFWQGKQGSGADGSLF